MAAQLSAPLLEKVYSEVSLGWGSKGVLVLLLLNQDAGTPLPSLPSDGIDKLVKSGFARIEGDRVFPVMERFEAEEQLQNLVPIKDWKKGEHRWDEVELTPFTTQLEFTHLIRMQGWLPEWRINWGMNGIDRRFAKYVKDVYLPKFYRSAAPDMVNAIQWINKRDRSYETFGDVFSAYQDGYLPWLKEQATKPAEKTQSAVSSSVVVSRVLAARGIA